MQKKLLSERNKDRELVVLALLCLNDRYAKLPNSSCKQG